MISLLQLQYFQAVAQTGNLTQAAKKLHISQTTLSAMLTKMENEMEIQLFDRRKSRIYLNTYGETFLKHVNMALAELEQGQQEIISMRAQKNSTLTVCTASEYIWGEAMLSFASKCPEVHITHYHDQISHFTEELLCHRIDFVIAGEDDIQSEKLEHCIIGTNRLCVCVFPSHPMANRKEISLSELSNVPMVNLTHDTPFQQFMDRLFVKAGICPPSSVECGYRARPRYTAQGLGVAVTNDVKICRDVFPGHIFIPITDTFSRRNIAIYWLRGRKFTFTMQKFYDFIKEYVRNNIVE